MGFLNRLSRFGSRVGKALTGDTAKKVLNRTLEIGKKIADSAVGSAVIDGIVEGSMRSLAEGDAWGESVKKGILGNLGVMHGVRVDPLDVGQIENAQRISKVEIEELDDKMMIKYDKEIEKEFGEDIKKIKKFMEGTLNEEITMEKEIELGEKAVEGVMKVVQHQEKGLKRLGEALSKETYRRSEDEQKMRDEYMSSIIQLQHAIKTEKDALTEEATELILDIGSEAAEDAMEEVPFFGAGAAAASASARAVVMGLRLEDMIRQVTGIELQPLTMSGWTPQTIDAVVNAGEIIEDKALVPGILAKAAKYEESNKELQHISDKVLKLMKKTLDEEKKKHSNRALKVMKSRNHLPMKKGPGLHIYTAAWDSDNIIIFHVSAPLHLETGFVLCVDLETETVFYEEDVGARVSAYEGNVHVPRTVMAVMQEFIVRIVLDTDMSVSRERKLHKSSYDSPLYMGRIKCNASYAQLKSNALQIAVDHEVQSNILRGPKSYQRMRLLDVLQHGLIFVEQHRSPIW